MTAYTLIELYNSIDVLLLIFIRFLAFTIIFPVFSGQNFNSTLRMGFSIGFAVLVYSSGVVGTVTYNNSLPGYVYLLVLEFAVGFLIGFVVYMVFNIVYFAGQLIDFQIGLSMVNILDPFTQMQVPVVGNLYYFVISVLLVQTGGLNAFITAVYLSFEKLPIGSANILGNPGLAWNILQLLAVFIVSAVRMALPVVGSILVIDVSMGLLVKAVPNMNVFVVGLPIKLLAGLLLMVILTPLLSSVYTMTFDDGYQAVVNIVRGMSP